MVYMLYHSVYRIPVGMYIGDVHENGNHQSAVMEIFVFIHLLNYHDTSVGRSHYGFFRISFEQSNRAAEKIGHQ